MELSESASYKTIIADGLLADTDKEMLRVVLCSFRPKRMTEHDTEVMVVAEAEIILSEQTAEILEKVLTKYRSSRKKKG